MRNEKISSDYTLDTGVDDNFGKKEGKITINGKGVKRILIDGKEFMTGDTKTALKGLVNAGTDLLVVMSAVVCHLFPDC